MSSKGDRTIVHVANLPSRIRKGAQLFPYFKPYGEVLEQVNVERDHGTVIFRSYNDAARAVLGEDGKKFGDQVLDVYILDDSGKEIHKNDIKDIPPPSPKRGRRGNSRRSRSRSRSAPRRSRSPPRSPARSRSPETLPPRRRSPSRDAYGDDRRAPPARYDERDAAYNTRREPDYYYSRDQGYPPGALPPGSIAPPMPAAPLVPLVPVDNYGYAQQVPVRCEIIYLEPHVKQYADRLQTFLERDVHVHTAVLGVSYDEMWPYVDSAGPQGIYFVLILTSKHERDQTMVIHVTRQDGQRTTAMEIPFQDLPLLINSALESKCRGIEPLVSNENTLVNLLKQAVPYTAAPTNNASSDAQDLDRIMRTLNSNPVLRRAVYRELRTVFEKPESGNGYAAGGARQSGQQKTNY